MRWILKDDAPLPPPTDCLPLQMKFQLRRAFHFFFFHDSQKLLLSSLPPSNNIKKTKQRKSRFIISVPPDVWLALSHEFTSLLQTENLNRWNEARGDSCCSRRAMKSRCGWLINQTSVCLHLFRNHFARSLFLFFSCYCLEIIASFPPFLLFFEFLDIKKERLVFRWFYILVEGRKCLEGTGKC